jgi:hypothetical protein
MATGKCLLCNDMKAEIETTITGVHVIQRINCLWCGQWCLAVDVIFLEIRAASPQTKAALPTFDTQTHPVWSGLN